MDAKQPWDILDEEGEEDPIEEEEEVNHRSKINVIQ